MSLNVYILAYQFKMVFKAKTINQKQKSIILITIVILLKYYYFYH